MAACMPCLGRLHAHEHAPQPLALRRAMTRPQTGTSNSCLRTGTTSRHRWCHLLPQCACQPASHCCTQQSMTSEYVPHTNHPPPPPKPLHPFHPTQRVCTGCLERRHAAATEHSCDAQCARHGCFAAPAYAAPPAGVLPSDSCTAATAWPATLLTQPTHSSACGCTTRRAQQQQQRRLRRCHNKSRLHAVVRCRHMRDVRAAACSP
jgi:hypothetical protein